MVIENIDIESAINNVNEQLQKKHDISPALRPAIEVLLIKMRQTETLEKQETCWKGCETSSKTYCASWI